VSLSLLGWLLASLDFHELRTTLAGARWTWLIVPHVLTPVTLLCGVWRWQTLLRSRNVVIPNGAAWRYLVMGCFVSNFLPSNVGGDVARASLVARHGAGHRWSASAGAVVVDRVCGLVAILVVLPIFAGFHYRWLHDLGVILPLACACAGILTLTVFVFSDWAAGLLHWLGRMPLLRKPAAIASELHDAMVTFRRQPRAIAAAIGISSIFYVVSGVQVWCLLLAFPQVDVAWSTMVITFAAVSLLAMLPVSINGYGVQEGGYVFFLASLGFTHNAAVALALANRLLSIAISVAGAVFFAFSDLSRAELANRKAEVA
jgi:uncharacterized protein (TIRG00374 family)